ncbi:hypothetical protein [Psychromonas antarctica]|jgi:hypothetical protein|uniref:hypothetical protein n=1 Tax=Psychromonas antarctica TaxID=67573 RepID=UPI001EE8A972|nr:hypothetical protein [Psychromonas antarctica]MCG6201519.1 hypothetical protein [Psychromonas antarctica]
MGSSSSNSQQFDDEDDDAEVWEGEDDWEEDVIHARKEHQNHRGRGKGQVRRNIEDIKEQQQLKELLGDDFDD